MEEHFLGHPPSSLITSTLAVDARDQFIIDTEKLGRNVASKLSKIPQEYAAKLCRRYLESGSVVGEHGCWVSSYAGMFQTVSSQRLRVVSGREREDSLSRATQSPANKAFCQSQGSSRLDVG